MKIDDDLLEALGKAYRIICGRNEVLVTPDRRVIIFETFIREVLAFRDQRGISA